METIYKSIINSNTGAGSSDFFKENSSSSYSNEPKFNNGDNQLDFLDNGLSINWYKFYDFNRYDSRVFEEWEKPFIAKILNKSIIAPKPDSLRYASNNDNVSINNFTNVDISNLPNFGNPYLNQMPVVNKHEFQSFNHRNEVEDLLALLGTNNSHINQNITSTSSKPSELDESATNYPQSIKCTSIPVESGVPNNTYASSLPTKELWNPHYTGRYEEFNGKPIQTQLCNTIPQLGVNTIPDYQPPFNMPLPVKKFSDSTMLSSYGVNYNNLNPLQDCVTSYYCDQFSPHGITSTAEMYPNDNSNSEYPHSSALTANFNYSSDHQYHGESYTMYNDVLCHLNKLLNQNNNMQQPDSKLNTSFKDFILQNDSTYVPNIGAINLGDLPRNFAGSPTTYQYKGNVLVGIFVNNLTELFKNNFKNEPNKHLLSFSNESELLNYISNCIFYGNCIQALNVSKLFDIGLEKQELILVIRQWLLQIYSNEYILLKNTNAPTAHPHHSNEPQNPLMPLNQHKNNALTPFVHLKRVIHLFDTFIKNFEIIKTVLRENSNNGDVSSYRNSTDSSIDSNSSNKTIINSLFVQFTIKSYQEYNSHKSARSNNSGHQLVSNLTLPTTVNCLMYSEKFNDVKLFMLETENGALPDLIIMNLPHLWSRDGKQFVCHICENLYTRKYGLKIHLRTHNSNKPLACNVCKKTFRDPSNLVKHSKIHNKYHLANNNDALSSDFESVSSVYNQKGESNNFKSSTLRKYSNSSDIDTPVLTIRKRASSYIQ